MEIDAAIDALLAALAARGLETPRPPQDDDALRALEAEIAPMTLPGDVRRWWERIDVDTLPEDLVFPAPASPSFALEGWQDVRRDFRGSQSLVLLVMAYESWNLLAVELDTPDGPGGATFRYSYDGAGFDVLDRRFADWVARLAEAVADGLDQDGVQDALDGHVLEHRDDALYHWPRHWQLAAGLRPEDVDPPRGATTTLRDLLKTDPEQPAAATLVGHLEIDPLDDDDHSVGVRVKFDDGTKKVVLTGDDRFVAWEVWGKWAVFEVDLSLTAGRRRRRRLDAIATIDAIRFAREL